MDLVSLSKHAFITIVAIMMCCFYTSILNAQTNDSLSEYILTPRAGPEPHIIEENEVKFL